MKKITLLFLCVLYTSLAFAQWPKIYNGTGNGMDEIKAMVADNAGNVYVTGYALNAAKNYDYVTIKYNTSGVKQWQASYDGPGHGGDIPAAIYVDNAGNVYVTGTSDQLTGYYINNDVATIKYNVQGIKQWVSRYDNVTLQRDDAGTAIRGDANGNIYVAGYTTKSNSAYSRKDYLTIKYNASGVQQWAATYDGPAHQDDAAVGLGIDASGNIYVTGTSFAGRDKLQANDYLTIKYNPAGDSLWTARYDGPVSRSDYATAIAVDNSGNVYVTGYSRGSDLDYATLKYNTNGVQQWVARYDGPAHSGDLSFAVAVDNSGNVYVTGTDQKIIYNGDFLTIKYNSSGVQQWTARYDGAAHDNDGANALALDASGNVYVTGGINGSSPSFDITTVKYSNAGVQQWVKTFNGAKDSADIGNAIAVDGSGNVYVAGATTGKTSHYDFITLKYASAGFAVQSENTLTAETNALEQSDKQPVLYQNYPNPFSSSTLIEYYLPKAGNTKIRMNDLRGNIIKEIQIGNVAAGKHSIIVNSKQLSKGTYFYTLTSGGFSLTKKMILK